MQRGGQRGHSLVGSTSGDRVGFPTAQLPNGGYVVVTSTWDNGTVSNAGAVSIGAGNAALVGSVTAANSVLGTVAGGFMPFSYDAVRTRLVVGHPASNTVTLVSFGAPPTRTLTVQTAGPGSVSSEPAGIDCGTDCDETYALGTTVQLTATPSAGATFAGWSGECSGTGPCQVTLDEDRAVTATFDADTTAPDTTITSGPAAVTNDSTPTFEFVADEEGSTFTCSMDGTEFLPCTSPHTSAPLADQPHSFAVRAADRFGNTDAAPASLAFTVDTGTYSVTFGPPVDGHAVLNVAKAGRVIPVKAEVFRNGAEDRTGPVFLQPKALSSCPADAAAADVGSYATASSVGSRELAWDPEADRWSLMFDTSELAPGGCHRVEVYVGGGLDAAGQVSGGALAGHFLLKLTR